MAKPDIRFTQYVEGTMKWEINDDGKIVKQDFEGDDGSEVRAIINGKIIRINSKKSYKEVEAYLLLNGYDKNQVEDMFEDLLLGTKEEYTDIEDEDAR